MQCGQGDAYTQTEVGPKKFTVVRGYFNNVKYHACKVTGFQLLACPRSHNLH